MKNIYLAEDDADDRMFFEDALKCINIPAELTVTKDGSELMLKLDDQVPPSPDVVFLDLNMPRKNGFECLKEIRDTPKLKEIPVVIFSTSDSPQAIALTYDLGANFYIQKPGSFNALKKIIETMLTTDLTHTFSKEKFFLKFA